MQLMQDGQPLPFDKAAANKYLKDTCAVHGTVQVGRGPWGREVAGRGYGLASVGVAPCWRARLVPELAATPVRLLLRPAASPLPVPSSLLQVFVTVGKGPGKGMAWGCDLSYDYVKINAEYTT